MRLFDQDIQDLKTKFRCKENNNNHNREAPSLSYPTTNWKYALTTWWKKVILR